MKKALFLLSVFAVGFSFAQAPVQQEREYILRLPASQVRVILQGLGELPVKVAEETKFVVLNQVGEQEQLWAKQAEQQQKSDSTAPKKSGKKQ